MIGAEFYCPGSKACLTYTRLGIFQKNSGNEKCIYPLPILCALSTQGGGVLSSELVPPPGPVDSTLAEAASENQILFFKLNREI